MSFLLGLVLGVIGGLFILSGSMEKYIVLKYEQKAEITIDGEKYKVIKVE